MVSIALYHWNVNVVGWFAAPFAGEARSGTFGAFGAVVKFQIDEYTLVPDTFVALTLQ